MYVIQTTSVPVTSEGGDILAITVGLQRDKASKKTIQSTNGVPSQWISNTSIVMTVSCGIVIIIFHIWIA